MRLLVAALVLLASPAHADPPCVSRAKFSQAGARDARLDGQTLRFCLGSSSCWAMDLATRAFTAQPFVAQKKKYDPNDDPDLYQLESKRARATNKQVTFCPSGEASCQSFPLRFKFDGSLSATVNDEGTLATLTYAGISEEDQPTFVLLFDLGKKKLVKKLKAGDGFALGNSFLVDDTIYSAAGKKLGAIEGAGGVPLRIPATSLVVFPDHQAVLIADAATGKRVHKVALDLKAQEGQVHDALQLVPSPDGKLLHVVAGSPLSGEVFTIDVASGTLLAQGGPPVCAAK